MREVADILEEMPDAFLPEMLRGQLDEAEHFARYWWLAQAVTGRRVLDAGCGTAHGSQLLAEAGANAVIGIDSASSLLEAARPEHPVVRLQQGDACALQFEDGTFEIVVAFGLLDRLADPELALSELLRVLAPDGMIVISVPPAGIDEHNVGADATGEDVEKAGGDAQHGLTSDKAPLTKTIETAVAHACRRHRVLHQRNWMTSAILDEDASAANDGKPLDGLEVRKVAEAAARSELVTLIVGSRGDEPKMHGTAVITHEFAQRRWLERSLALERRLAERTSLDRELKDALLERKLLAERLLALENEP